MFLAVGSLEKTMNCPTCSVSLVISERQGVEIDYCPQCRGVWLDRGELDKIIERSSRDEVQIPRSYDSHRSDDDYKSYPKKHKKKESFLSDIFDF